MCVLLFPIHKCRKSELTGSHIFQVVDLRICLVDDLVHLRTEYSIFVCKTLGKIFLVYAARSQPRALYVCKECKLHFLTCLVAVESKGSPCTFHDDAGTETAQNAGLVVFRRVKLRCNDIIDIREPRLACRTCSLVTGSIGQAESISTLDTKYVAENEAMCQHVH